MKQDLKPATVAVVIIVVLVVVALIGWKVVKGGGDKVPETQDAMDTVDEGMMDQMEQEAADTGEDKSGIDDAGGAM